MRCVESIKKAVLGITDWELVIVDDNSEDGTKWLTASDLEIANAKIIHNSTREMLVRSRNGGFKNSGGKYILFIDDDNVVTEKMIELLLNFAKENDTYGIIGPSMCYLESQKKYLDFQKINLFTGKTSGEIDNTEQAVCDSDGIPNAFLIKREVFEKCGQFDEAMIQTFTEPDFAFRVRKFGYRCGIVKKAEICHNVFASDDLSARALGGQFSQKAYCLMRNRMVIVARYGKWFHKVVYLLVFSWLWPIAYSFFVLREKRFDLIKLYWRGFFDGLKYFFTGELKNSLEK